MWHESAHRLALLELFQTELLQKREAQSQAWDELLKLGWARRTSRQNQLALVPKFRDAISEALDGSWPSWRVSLQELLARNLQPTESGLQALLREQRLRSVERLPKRVNQRTAAAVIREHSKVHLGDVAQQSLPIAEITSDYIVRLRGCLGLSLSCAGESYDAALLEKIQGELVLSERAFLDGTALHGTPKALLLVENLGPFVDLVPQPGWLLVHVPGWQTHAAKRLFELFPQVPALHFGDLDPEGCKIHRHLRDANPLLRWVTPDWIADYMLSHGHPKEWPCALELDTMPLVIQKLVQQRRWIEQEALVLDDRLWPTLQVLAEL